MYICRLVNSFGSEVSSLTLWLPARWLSCKENLLLRPNFGIWAMHWGWKICLYHKGCHMIHSFSSEQHKGHLLNRNCTDVFQRQPHRFRCLLSLFLCHVEEWTPPCDPITLPVRFLVAAGESPLVTWLGTSIVRRGGRKWSGSQASQQPHSTPGRSKAKSLSTSRITAGTEVAYCPMGAAHIYVRKSFPLTAVSEEYVLLLSSHWASVFTQRRTEIPQRCGKSTWTHEVPADDEIVGLFM